ncbi:MAG: SDR family oxidoreductase [Alphaproteobacteria bacterium]
MRVLIANGSGPMGSNVARRLADDGSQVAISAATESAAKAAVTPLAKAKGKTFPIIGNTRTPEGTQQIVADAVAKMGGLDGLVVCLETSCPGRLLDLDIAALEGVLQANSRSLWLLVRAAHPHLKASAGAIVAIGRPAVLSPKAGETAYSAALAGAHLIVRVLAQELARDRIRVNFVTADDAGLQVTGGPVRFLLGPQASYITGQNTIIDGSRLDAARS